MWGSRKDQDLGVVGTPMELPSLEALPALQKGWVRIMGYPTAALGLFPVPFPAPSPSAIPSPLPSSQSLCKGQVVGTVLLFGDVCCSLWQAYCKGLYACSSPIPTPPYGGPELSSFLPRPTACSLGSLARSLPEQQQLLSQHDEHVVMTQPLPRGF